MRLHHRTAAIPLCLLLCLAQCGAQGHVPLLQWDVNYGGDGTDIAWSAALTRDGGYYVAGSSTSLDGDVCGNIFTAAYGNCWVIKLDSAGNIVWQNCYQADIGSGGFCIDTTSDGGCIVAGWVNDDNDNGGDDFLVIKYSAAGQVEWHRLYGGSDNEQAFSVRQTAEGGYIVAGWTASQDGDVSGNKGLANYWVVKLDAQGALVWQRCYGGSGGFPGDDGAYDIRQTPDGGYIIAGGTACNDGDVTGNSGVQAWWIVKTDSVGAIAWQRCYSMMYNDNTAFSITQTQDGGYFIAGESSTDQGNGFEGRKIDSVGNEMWANKFADLSEAFTALATHDGGYAIAGYQYLGEYLDTVRGLKENDHFYLIKLAPDSAQDRIAFVNYPTPSSGAVTILYATSARKQFQAAVFDVLGRKIADIHDGMLAPGVYSYILNAHALGCGAYFCRAAFNDRVIVTKFIVVR
jgi:hypothetical protein